MAEELPLLHDDSQCDTWLEQHDVVNLSGLRTSQLMRLYLSHFLSTWNSRCYEFAAVGVFPQSCFRYSRDSWYRRHGRFRTSSLGFQEQPCDEVLHCGAGLRVRSNDVEVTVSKVSSVR
jgi:hypothetical protein